MRRTRRKSSHTVLAAMSASIPRINEVLGDSASVALGHAFGKSSINSVMMAAIAISSDV